MKSLWPVLPLLAVCSIRDNDGGGSGGDGGGGGGGRAGEGGGEGAGGGAAGGEKTFTQADVDRIVVNRNRALKEQLTRLESNYQGLLEQQNLTSEQRQKLESDLEAVQAQLRTKEQQAAHERKKAEEKYANELKRVQDEASTWKNRFETTMVEQSILDAAAKSDAFQPEQFIALLSGRTKVQEEIDSNGQKTGRLVPLVSMEVMDETTKQMQTVLKSPAEAVSMMKEDVSRYGNLFKANVARGLNQGGNSGQGQGRVDPTKLTAEQYMEMRKNPAARRQLGLS